VVNHLDRLPGRFFGPSNLVEMLRHRAHCQSQDTAFTYLVDGETEELHLSYEQLDRQARAIGAWLESHDLVGQRALLLYPAGLEFVAAFFGCLYAGVVAVPVYPPRRNRSLTRIQSIADDANAKVALTTEAVLKRVEPLIDETPHLKALAWQATCRVSEGLADNWQMPDVHGDTLAFLQYTSGSTGTPKGVVLNHANLIHNSALIAHAFEHTRSGTGVFWLPSYHDMGLIGGILQPLYVGRPNVLMSPMTFLQKPFRWLSAISRYQGTTSGGPNFAYDLCVEKISPQQCESLDLSTWKVAFNGAEPVRAETLKRFAEKFEPYGFSPRAFYPCYGMAEATLIVSGGFAVEPPVVRTFDAALIGEGQAVEVPPGAEGARELVGCGQSLPDQQIVIADPETRRQLPEARVGEIWVRGPSVAQGYWQHPELSEQVFRARLADTNDGPYLRTGDLGYMFEGQLFVTGRVKDLIIVRGVNHYPQDIELTVQQTNARLRRDCGAAFTVEVGDREQFVFVQEVERHKKKDFDSIFDAVRRAVATEHDLMLDAMVLIKAGSIPKTSSGKIQRHACRQGFLDGSLQVVAQWENTDAAPPPTEGQRKPDVNAEAPARPAASASATVTATQKPESAATQPKPGVKAPAASNGRAVPVSQRTIDVVLEEINRVAKGRAASLTLDMLIVETGLDSLERMEILASIEERYGGRLPEEIFPDLETVRQLAAAVEKYLGLEPRPREVLAEEAEIPSEYYVFEEFPEIAGLRERLDFLEGSEIGNPFFNLHYGLPTATIVRNGRELINFSSFNYTCTAAHPYVRDAAKKAIDEYGSSASASRLVSGEKQINKELEATIANLLGVEDSITFVAGHSCNESVIGHLMGPGDLILHDGLAHNSIVQGAILSGARRRPFTHNQWEAADDILKHYRHEYRRVMIAIEGVYSMDGDIADVPKFIEVAKRHKALLMIDEAHSIGVLGRNGSGVGDYFGVNPEDVDVWMGTMSKSMASAGGYIAGRKALIEYLRYTTPSYVFAVGISPAQSAAAKAAIEVWQREPELFTRLHENARLFLSLCKQHGLNTGPSDGTPIVPVILGNSIHCLMMCKRMADRGVNVMPILHPAVEENASRLRFFINALHTEQQIRHTIDVMVDELEKLDPEYVRGTAGGAAAR